METIGNVWLWAGFLAFAFTMIMVDLFLLGGRKAHKVSLREAGLWSLVWVAMALIFCAGLWWYLDDTVGRAIANQRAIEFLTGYLIEKSLAVDNIFVWLMLFSYFAIPPAASCIALWSAWRDRHAHGNDSGRCLAAGAVPLDSVCLRCFFIVYRIQDGVFCRA
jgi:hypothetical protein